MGNIQINLWVKEKNPGGVSLLFEAQSKNEPNWTCGFCSKL